MLDKIDHRKLLQDDRTTVALFVEGLEALTLRIARHRYRLPRAEAEDILLEILRKLWDSDKSALRAWRGEGSLETYLRAIVHRACLMELRRRKRRPVEHATDSLDSFQAAHAPMPVEQEQLQDLYHEAAADLGERDRTLLRMRFLEEHDYETITAELGISHGAARKAVHTALSRVRERLRKLAPDLFCSEAAP